MAETFHIVGDGLAGLMLALRLRAEGGRAVVYGDEQTNTPPVGMMHLFAGRTFRRDALELQAFKRAVRFWRGEPLAVELPVRRKITEGDRLWRSLEGHELPGQFAPVRASDGWVEYRPGFAIASQLLEKRLRQELDVKADCVRREATAVPEPRVLAAGHAMPELMPEVAWDVLVGRTVEASPQLLPSRITIGLGVHVAPWPGRTTVVVGGRSSPKGEAKDELVLAGELLGEPVREESIWTGTRCAPARDRRPALGWTERGFAFCGFGSRALFWLPLCLDIATGALLRKEPIPPELHCRRLSGGDSSQAL